MDFDLELDIEEQESNQSPGRMYRLQLTDIAEQDLSQLPNRILHSIQDTITNLSESKNPNSPNIKHPLYKLQGSKENATYSIPINNHRLLYNVNNYGKTITILGVKP